MSPVARAWLRTQDRKLVRAMRHAFCGHTGRYPCRCLTTEDKELIAAWVERTVMRNQPTIYRPRVRDGGEDDVHTREEIYVVTDDEMRPMLFRCKRCTHAPFTSDRGLAQHVGKIHKDAA